MAEGLLVAFVLIVVGALKMWVYETERRKREDGTAGFWTRNLFEGISVEALSGSSDDRSSPRLEDRDVDAVAGPRSASVRSTARAVIVGAGRRSREV
jgi:hypothetical protein